MQDKLDELHCIYKMIGNYGFRTVQELLDKYKTQKEVIDKVKNVQIEMPKSNYSYDYMIYRSKIDEILKEVAE